MIEVRAPGKLYIAGEYAVVEPGHPAVLVAVDRYVTVSLDSAHDDAGRIISDQYGRLPVTWHRRGGDLVLEADETPFDFVLGAIAAVEEVVRQRDLPVAFFELRIESELDDASGRKFGLGSSAAVTVATVQAVSRFYGLELNRLEQLKLALATSMRVQPNGSGGDVAASLYGGWLAYSSPDRAWLQQQLTSRPLDAIIQEPWPGLTVRQLPRPTGLRLRVGWTGTPASTSRLVVDVRERGAHEQERYTEFLRSARAAVGSLIAAIESEDAPGVQQGIRTYRRLLAALSEETGAVIETPALRLLVESAESFGAAAKSSGAGGGDCGIVLADDGADLERLMQAWAEAGIRPLELNVHFNAAGSADAAEATRQ